MKNSVVTKKTANLGEQEYVHRCGTACGGASRGSIFSLSNETSWKQNWPASGGCLLLTTFAAKDIEVIEDG